MNDALMHPDAERRAWIPFFSMSFEQNLPTWVATLLLCACGSLLLFVGSLRSNDPPGISRRFRILALLFFYISLDEFAEIHEAANAWFDLDGIFHFSWVVIAGPIVLVLGLYFIELLRVLPRAVARLFVLSGALFVGGALFVELGLGYWTDRYGENNIVYALIDWLQESMELSGVALFFYSLVDLLRRDSRDVSLRIMLGDSDSGII